MFSLLRRFHEQADYRASLAKNGHYCPESKNIGEPKFSAENTIDDNESSISNESLIRSADDFQFSKDGRLIVVTPLNP